MGLGWHRVPQTLLHSFPLLAVPVNFSEKQQAPHYLYMRQHSVRQGTQSTWPPNRTLFILNVPPYCTQVRVLREDQWVMNGGLPRALRNPGSQTEMLTNLQ